MSKRIAIAEDHSIVRWGLKMLIDKMDDVEFAWEANDGLQAITMLEKDQPDVLLSDISMPKMSGLDVLKYVKAQNMKTQVLVLSMHNDEQYIYSCLEHGASGYVFKDSSDIEIREAIRALANGEEYYGRSVKEALRTTSSGKSVGKDFGLTKRELEVLSYLVKGNTNKEVANKLFVSVSTVDSHRTNIMKKLDVHNSAELVWMALSNKIISILAPI